MQNPFGKKLKTLMDERGLSNEELSFRTGISQQAIGQYILGRYKPKLPNLFAIASALGVDVRIFFTC